jgi:hypothetical protein
MFYVRTADKLERTATWFEKREGGIEELREILLEDSLGICDELEAQMAEHVAGYEDEWAAVLADPAKLARFQHFVNEDVPDPDLAYVRERGQRRPAFDHERPRLPLLAADPWHTGGRLADAAHRRRVSLRHALASRGLSACGPTTWSHHLGAVSPWPPRREKRTIDGVNQGSEVCDVRCASAPRDDPADVRESEPDGSRGHVEGMG